MQVTAAKRRKMYMSSEPSARQRNVVDSNTKEFEPVKLDFPLFLDVPVEDAMLFFHPAWVFTT